MNKFNACNNINELVRRGNSYWQNILNSTVTTHFKKLGTLKNLFKVRYIWDQVNALWKKNIFFSKCVNISHINALWKNFENQILHGSLYFYCLKISKTINNFENESIPSNILSTILFIVRSFVKVWSDIGRIQVVCIMQIKTIFA